MNKCEKDTAIGGGVGGVADSMLAGGDGSETVGSAEVGGVIGDEVGKVKK
jgi:osmotically inducible lipoprotein OsmB